MNDKNIIKGRRHYPELRLRSQLSQKAIKGGCDWSGSEHSRNAFRKANTNGIGIVEFNVRLPISDNHDILY